MTVIPMIPVVAMLYKEDGTSQLAPNPKNPKRGYTLQELYEILQCRTIEIVYPPNLPEWKLVVDEEGLIFDLKPNPDATRLMGHLIVGLALLCPKKWLK